MAQITIAAIKTEHEEVRKQAIEVWSTVFEEEIYIEKSIAESRKLGMQPKQENKKFAQKSISHLTPLLLETLKHKSENLDDENGVERAAAACLGLLAEAVRDDVLEPVLQFVSKNLVANNIKSKEAATTAIGLIMVGPKESVLLTIVSKVWKHLLENLMKGNSVLRHSTAWSIGRIFQYCPSSLDDTILSKVVQIFSTLLTKAHAKVASCICWSIGRLALLCPPNTPETPLSPYIKPLLQSLLGCAARADIETHNLLPATFEALNLLVKTSGDDMLKILSESLLPQLITELNKLVSNSQNNTVVNKTRELIGAVTTIVNRIGSLESKKSDLLMNIYFATLNHNFSSGVHEEAMASMGDIASIIGLRYIPHLPKTFNVICVGLNEGYKHPNLCRAAILLLGDVAGSCKEKILQYSDTFVELLLKNLAEPNLEFEMKPFVVYTIGDIALAVGPSFAKYTKCVMKYLVEAGSASPGDNPNQEDMTAFNT
eukprot:UN31009